MANEANSKIILFGETLIDLTADTVVESDVASGKTFHKANGQTATGTNTYNADTSDATAQASEILNGKTAYVNGNKVTGSMPNVGTQSSTITTKAQEVAIQNGFHDGSGRVKIDATEQAKIIAGNIKNGVKILGVTGTYTGGELIKATAGSATPTNAQQVVLPSQSGNYDYFTQFTVEAVPITRVVNASGGMTITIGSES